MTNENTKRIFLAATPDNHWQKKIAAIQSQLTQFNLSTIKLIPKDKYHITIHFWADIPIDKIKKITDCIQNICQYFPVFSVNFTDIILFPSQNRPRIIAVKIEQDDVLQNFRDELSQQFLDNGITVEQRIFKPHVSIARIFQKVHLSNPLLSQVFDTEPFYIESVTLFESIYNEQGNIYSPLATFELQ